MQASEMMYVFSPTSQRWRKTLLRVKKGFMFLLLLHSSDKGLMLKTLAIHQTSQAKLTISTLIDQTHIQLTHQCRKKNSSFFKTNFSVTNLNALQYRHFCKKVATSLTNSCPTAAAARYHNVWSYFQVQK